VVQATLETEAATIPQARKAVSNIREATIRLRKLLTAGQPNSSAAYARHLSMNQVEDELPGELIEVQDPLIDPAARRRKTLAQHWPVVVGLFYATAEAGLWVTPSG
jgi:hypothetical protein